MKRNLEKTGSECEKRRRYRMENREKANTEDDQFRAVDIIYRHIQDEEKEEEHQEIKKADKKSVLEETESECENQRRNSVENREKADTEDDQFRVEDIIYRRIQDVYRRIQDEGKEEEHQEIKNDKKLVLEETESECENRRRNSIGNREKADTEDNQFRAADTIEEEGNNEGHQEEEDESYDHRKIKNKKALNVFFDKILKNVSIDYSNHEIQDIQAALKEILHRIEHRINERGIFTISRIQACGSMEEKTALWKDKCIGIQPPERIYFSERKYIEFDYLAVLKKPKSCKIMTISPGCHPIKGSFVNVTRLRKYLDEYFSPEDLSCPYIIYDLFLHELRDALDSKCVCWENFSRDKFHDIQNTRCNCEKRCIQCPVYKPSGSLGFSVWQTDLHCTLKFEWKSNDQSLFTPNWESLEAEGKREYVEIKVDFLPALEMYPSSQSCQDTEHRKFLVSKPFSFSNRDVCRMSCCLTEIDIILKRMSKKHRECYKILKFLIFTADIGRSYFFKTAVIHHHRTCSDTSDDRVKCVVSILLELQSAIQRGILKNVSGEINLFDNDIGIISLLVELLLAVIYKFETWDRLYSGCTSLQLYELIPSRQTWFQCYTDVMKCRHFKVVGRL